MSTNGSPIVQKWEKSLKIKREYEERGGNGWELTLCLRIDILWSMGNPMPELTLKVPSGQV
jgi:hypothetical protein